MIGLPVTGRAAERRRLKALVRFIADRGIAYGKRGHMRGRRQPP